MKEEREEPLLGERWHRVAITERGLIAKHNDSSPLSVAYGDSRPRGASHLPIIFFIIERSFNLWQKSIRKF